MTTPVPPPPPVVRVGVAAVVQDAQGKMVMGRRKGSHGDGERAALYIHISSLRVRTS
jgi:hypothetical protein